MLYPTDSGRDAQQNPVRIVLADPQPVVCFGLSELLSAHSRYQIVATVHELDSLLELARSQQVDLLVVEPAFPGQGFLASLQTIRQEFATSNILVFTSFDLEFMVLEGIRLGIQGFLTKHTSTDAILPAIHTVADGQHYLDPRVTSRVTGQLGRHSERRHNRQRYLTPREHAVLELLAEGHCTRTISKTLAISERTVKYHITALLQKLHARNRVEVVRKAIGDGLIDS